VSTSSPSANTLPILHDPDDASVGRLRIRRTWLPPLPPPLLLLLLLLLLPMLGLLWLLLLLSVRDDVDLLIALHRRWSVFSSCSCDEKQRVEKAGYRNSQPTGIVYALQVQHKSLLDFQPRDTSKRRGSSGTTPVSPPISRQLRWWALRTNPAQSRE
jgi:hypothetical protein